MPLRNIPTDQAQALTSLIGVRPGQVSSMALARDAGVDMTLLAFAVGEDVSEETYAGDTLYALIEGRAAVLLPSGVVPIGAGEVLCVPADVPHAIKNIGCAFKLLQLTLK